MFTLCVTEQREKQATLTIITKESIPLAKGIGHQENDFNRTIKKSLVASEIDQNNRNKGKIPICEYYMLKNNFESCFLKINTEILVKTTILHQYYNDTNNISSKKCFTNSFI